MSQKIMEKGKLMAKNDYIVKWVPLSRDPLGLEEDLQQRNRASSLHQNLHELDNIKSLLIHMENQLNSPTVDELDNIRSRLRCIDYQLENILPQLEQFFHNKKKNFKNSTNFKITVKT